MIRVFGRGVVARRAAQLVEAPSLDLDREDGTVASGDVAILAHGRPQAAEARDLLRRGVHVVAVGDGIGDIAAMIELAPLATDVGRVLVVGAAASPGLSGLLARSQADQLAQADEVHVAIHGTAGPGCARTHHESMDGWALTWRDGDWRSLLAGGGRELCWFPEPVGAKDCYVARSAEPRLLHAAFPEVVRITHRRSARRRDRMTARLPMLSPPPAEGGIGGLRVEVRGAASSGARRTVIVGVAEFIGSAAAATAVAFAHLIERDRIPAGLAIPGAAELPTLPLLREVSRLGIRLQEFTGIPDLEVGAVR